MPEAENTRNSRSTKFKPSRWFKYTLVGFLGLVLLSGIGYGGYIRWRSRQVVSEPPVEKQASKEPQELWKSTGKSIQISAEEPSGVVAIKDGSLKFYSIDGALVKSVPLTDGAEYGSSGPKVSPDGQRVVFFGAPRNLPKKYIENLGKPGSGGLPGKDIFIYEKSTNKVARITDCTGDGSQGWQQGDLCYTDFDWGPDSDTYIYFYSSAEADKSHVGIGKISTGKKVSIYPVSFERPGQYWASADFSSGGQKIFVNSRSHFPGVVLISRDGKVIRKFTASDFPVQDVVSAKNPTIYARWGPTDEQAFLEVKTESPYHYSTRVVYAFDPSNPQKVRRITPPDENGAYGSTQLRGCTDEFGGNIALEYFNSTEPDGERDIAIFNWNADLIVKNLPEVTGARWHTPFSLYKDYALISTELGLFLVRLTDKKTILLEGLSGCSARLIP